MTKVSNALSPEKVSTYYKKGLGPGSDQRNYFAEGMGPGESGEWFGKEAGNFGLLGKPVEEEMITRLAMGQDPNTSEQLIKWRPAAKAPEPAWIKNDAEWRGRLEEVFAQAVQDGRDPFRHTREGAKSHKTPVAFEASAVKARTPREAALVAMHAEAREFYSNTLASDEGKAVRGYLVTARGIKAATSKEFGLGLGEETGKQLADRLRRYGPEMMRASGLFVERNGEFLDRFRGRLVVPIENERGETIAFAGRKAPGQEFGPKYVNSPETEIYRKGQILFNVHRAQERMHEGGQVVVVEGYFDAMAVHQAGVHNVVAVSGTALTQDHAQKLKIHANEAVLNLDGDKAGRDATERSVPILLDAGLRVRNLNLSGDPASWIKENGVEAYRKEVRQTPPLVQYLASEAKNKFDVGDAYGKADAMKWMVSTLEHVQPEQRSIIGKAIEKHLQHVDEPKLEKEPVQHRAAWDMTIGAPKTVSLTATVGGDDRVLRAHDEAAKEAFGYVQRSIQVKMGGLNAPETTGSMVAALFQHDTARPVDGYAAPHLHTHGVIFNMSRDENGQYRSLNPKELFYIQGTAEAVYQNRLAVELKKLGYEIEYGKNTSIEIEGYSEEYRKAESPRTNQIEAEKARLGQFGPEANSNSAINTRAAKLQEDPEVIRAAHREHAEKFGNQPEAVIQAANERDRIVYTVADRAQIANDAIDFAKARLSERTTVMESHEIHRDALKFGRGYITLQDVEEAFERKKAEFVRVEHWRSSAPGERWTTPEMIASERQILDFMVAGRNRFGSIAGEATKAAQDEFREQFRAHLNDDQKWLVWNLIHNTDRMVGVQGIAGAGKTRGLSTVRDYVEAYGYEVRGLAATSTAVKEMVEADVNAQTLQSFLAQKDGVHKRARMYLVDEASLVDVHTFAKFLQRMKAANRVIVVGDKQQHGSVGAGRVFSELQDAGMTTYSLKKIMRQQPEEYKAVVKELSKGEVIKALSMLDEQGRIQTAPHEGDRFRAIAKQVVESPLRTLVVSPDNRSRVEISHSIREAKQEVGQMSENVYRSRILNQRSDITQTDLRFAPSYQPGDVVLYRRDSKTGMTSGDYASVVKVDRDTNLLTVMRESDGKVMTYNPAKTATDAEVYEPTYRQFAIGERVQFTRQWRQEGTRVVLAANRARGTIEALDASGNVTVKLDTAEGKPERRLTWNLEKMPHIDYGYAMTSYSAQGATTDKVIVHIDTDAPNVQKMLSQQLAYVAVSRGKQDVQLVVNDREELERFLSRRPENATALAPAEVAQYQAKISAGR
jgi:DNA primase catalytic core